MAIILWAQISIFVKVEAVWADFWRNPNNEARRLTFNLASERHRHREKSSWKLEFITNIFRASRLSHVLFVTVIIIDF